MNWLRPGPIPVDDGVPVRHILAVAADGHVVRVVADIEDYVVVFGDQVEAGLLVARTRADHYMLDVGERKTESAEILDSSLKSRLGPD